MQLARAAAGPGPRQAGSSGTRPTQPRNSRSTGGNAAASTSPLATASPARAARRGCRATATAGPPFRLSETVATALPARRRDAEHTRERPLASLHPPRLGHRALVVVAEQMEHAVDEPPLRFATE